MPSWTPLDPDEILDFQIDWTDKLEDGEVITDSAWEIAEGDVEIETVSHAPGYSHSDEITTVWLTGGTVDTTCLVRNHITTSAGRERDRTMTLKLKAK